VVDDPRIGFLFGCRSLRHARVQHVPPWEHSSGIEPRGLVALLPAPAMPGAAGAPFTGSRVSSSLSITAWTTLFYFHVLARDVPFLCHYYCHKNFSISTI
jgi:hypothetical protein